MKFENPSEVYLGANTYNRPQGMSTNSSRSSPPVPMTHLVRTGSKANWRATHFNFLRSHGISLGLLILFFPIIVVLVTSVTHGESIYDESLWSDDFQVTHTRQSDYPYKYTLTVQEAYTGGFDALFAEAQYAHVFRISHLGIDEISGVITSEQSITDLGEIQDAAHGNEYIWTIHYERAIDRYRFIGREDDHVNLVFLELSGSGEIIYERHLSIIDLFPEVVNASTHSIFSIWDELGRAHIAGTILEDIDGSSKLFGLYYLVVDWGPLRVQAEIVCRYPHLDDSIYGLNLAIRDGLIAIAHPIFQGNDTYRGISIKGKDGTWRSVILSRWVNLVFNDNWACNGIYIDDSYNIHSVWVDGPAQPVVEDLEAVQVFRCASRECKNTERNLHCDIAH